MPNNFELEDWLPMEPQKGPPLPRRFQIFWPWYEAEAPPEGFKCPFCGATFATQEELNQHIREEHRIPIPITWGGTAGLATASEFEPGVAKTATVSMSNPTDKSWTYSAELYLGEGKVATSGRKSFSIPANSSKDISFTVIMPSAEGTYPVFIDVYVGTALITAYEGTEDVVITISPAIEVGPVVWAAR